MDFNALLRSTRSFPQNFSIEFFPDDMVSRFTINEPHRSIQTEAGAFEGWVLILHEMIPRWKIILDTPQKELETLATPRLNRFLYRVSRFCELPYTWLSASGKLAECAEMFMKLYINAPKRISYPRADGEKSDMVRHLLLNKFAASDSILQALAECKGSSFYTMFPVCIYRATSQRDTKSSNIIFPLNGSFIDLWCLNGDTLNVFMLRYQKPTVSFVSEMFYLVNCCRDIFLDGEKCNITFPPLTTTPHRGFDEFYGADGRREIRAVNAWFLADKYHQRINEAYICDMLSAKPVSYHCLKYSYDFPVMLEG